MQSPVKLDFLWSGLCMLGAVYFMFRALRRILRGNPHSSEEGGWTFRSCFATRDSD